MLSFANAVHENLNICVDNVKALRQDIISQKN